MPDDHRGVRAIQRMVEFAPSTGGLALWVRHENSDDPASPTVMTDGETLVYGPAFDRLPLPEQTGWVAHEVLHIALRHPQRALELRRLLGDVDLRLFNICADAIVNSTLSHLTWLKLPQNAVFLDHLLAQALERKQDVETALLEWDVERLYRAIDDRKENTGQQSSSGSKTSEAQSPDGGSPKQGGSPSQPSPRQDGPRAAQVRAMGGQTESDLAPGPEDTAPELEAEQSREWSERLLRGHTGDGDFSMLRALIADLPRTRTPWRQLLRTRLAKGLSRKQSLSWSRPTRSYIANQGRAGDKRMPFEPGHCANKMEPRLAIIVDVSGSIDDGLLECFANEICAISRRQEAGLILVIGDDQVRRVEVFQPGRLDLGRVDFSGGGGTDFTPLLECANQYRPDIGVVLTDLEGPARFQPVWPVIWAVPEANALAQAPFGQKLTLEHG